jgi:uncharacterized protein
MDPVVHFELPAKDMSRAKSFYEKVFGWTFNAYSNEYWLACTTPVDEKMMAQKPGEINGAIQKKDKTIGSARIGITVGNIDDTIERVKSAGGKLLQPITEVPGMLLFCIMADTEGNEISIVQNTRKS